MIAILFSGLNVRSSYKRSRISDTLLRACASVVSVGSLCCATGVAGFRSHIVLAFFFGIFFERGEAEAVAFIVGQAIGLAMGTSSSDYIQMYAGNAALLTESLEVIQHTSAAILAAILPEESHEERALSAEGSIRG